MAKDKLKISIRNEAGEYYYATLNNDNTYTVATQPTVRYLNHLPIGWEASPQRWDRDLAYGGVFTAQAEPMQFVKDGRAIIRHITFAGGGVNAYALVTVYKLNEDTKAYDVFFSAEVDCPECENDGANFQLTAPLLQGKANEFLKSQGRTSFNIPFWVPDGEDWAQNDTEYLRMNQVKVLWHRDFFGAQNDTSPIPYKLRGWNDGEHGTGPNSGCHTIPYLVNFVKVQNNGSTTYVGNDVMNEIIDNSIEQQQRDEEINFLDGGNMYQLNQGVFKTRLQQEMKVTISGKIDGDVTVTSPIGTSFIVAFVLFEIFPNGEPPQSTPGFYDFYQSICQFTVTAPGPWTPPDSGNFSASANVTFHPGRSYALGIIFDGDGFPVPGTFSSQIDAFVLSALTLTIESNYNSGTSTPVTAPGLPISYVPSFGSYTLWQKLVKCLDSVTTDSHGFPEIVGQFTGVSTYMSSDNDPADNYGLAIDKLQWTSENALRNIPGIQYLTTSLSEYYTTLRKIDGIGMGIEGNNFRIEKLRYFFDKDTLILDLGSKVKGLKCRVMSDEMFNHIKCGYKKPALNNLYGCDEPLTEAEYQTESRKTPKTVDWNVGGAIAGQYEQEKMRVQTPQNDVPSPSASNACVLVQRSDDTPSSKTVYDPAGEAHSVVPYYLLTFPTAQSTDPTAASAPFVRGMLYPETARNLGLLGPLCLLRNGPLLHSFLDGMDSTKISFRKVYQMNYNNPVDVLEQPGVSVNIPGAEASTTGDIIVGDLDAPIFRPYLFTFTAAYPQGMYALINAKPRGYIRFEWGKYAYMGFINNVKQYAGDNRPSEFELICHPDVTDEQLRAI